METKQSIDWAAVHRKLQAKREARGAQPTDAQPAQFGPLFRAAALRPVFTTGELLLFAQEKAEKSALTPEQELAQLLTQSEPVQSPDGTQRWRLPDALRQQILTDLGTLQRLAEYLPEGAADSSDLRQRWLARCIHGEKPDLRALPLADLNALSAVAYWLAAYRNDGVPEQAAVQAELKRKELLAPLQRITEHFSGRSTELAQLAQFAQAAAPAYPGSRYDPAALQGFGLMLHGIGGAGKTTLLAKFILDFLQNQQQSGFGFCYVDYDRPDAGTEPLALLDEMARQLQLQMPADAAQLQEWRDVWKRSFGGSGTRGYERDFYLGPFAHWWQRGGAQRPLLLVLDSFEEVQNWIESADRQNLLVFLVELGRAVPGLKVVFSGRANVDYFALQEIPLGDFDEAAALGFLKAQGVANEVCAREIWQYVGGNPLNLKLAAAEAKGAGCENLQALFGNIDAGQLREVLFRRQLDHIHDPKVRQLAVPGLVLRNISAELIREVLAMPCGLGAISAKEADGLMEHLRKEAFLVEFDQQTWRFRPDLRSLLLDLSALLDVQKTKQVHDLAVAYYAPKTADPAAQAEWAYHRLKRGDSPAALGALDFGAIQPYLRQAMQELPLAAQAFLYNGFGMEMPEEIRDSMALPVWENDRATAIRNSFITAEEAYLQRLAEEIAQRPERSPNSALHLPQAMLLERLGRSDEALALLQRAANEAKKALDPAQSLQATLRQAELQARKQAWGEAASLAEQARRSALQRPDALSACRALLLELRNRARLGNSDADAADALLAELQALDFQGIKNQDAHPWLQDLLPENFFSRKLQKAPTQKAAPAAPADDSPFSFRRFSAALLERLLDSWLPQAEWVENLQKLREMAPDNEALEALSRQKLQRPMREICLPGAWSACSFDLLLFAEKEGLVPVLLRKEPVPAAGPPSNVDDVPNNAPPPAQETKNIVLPNQGPSSPPPKPQPSRSASAMLSDLGGQSGSEDIKATVQQLVASARTEEAIKVLMDFTRSNPALGDAQNQAVMLSGRHSSLKRDNNLGLLDSQDYLRGQAQINYALLELVQTLTRTIDLQVQTSTLSDVQIQGQGAFERLEDKNNLLKINWLQRALEAAQAVGMRFMPNGAGAAVFWIQDEKLTQAPKLMSKLVGSGEKPEQARYEFNFSEFKGGMTAGRTYAPLGPYVVDSELGFCITGYAGTPPPERVLRLNVGERPKPGQTLVVVTLHNLRLQLMSVKVLQSSETHFQVAVDSSSAYLPGSPVLDENWAVVGMMTSGIQAISMHAVAASLDRTRPDAPAAAGEEPPPPVDDKLGATRFVLLYEESDEETAKTLKKHLYLLLKNGKMHLHLLHADAQAGEDPWRRAEDELRQGDYALCLITPDFLAGRGLDFALSAQRRIIPILARKVSMEGSGLENLRSLPTQGRWLSDFPSPDAAYMDIATEIRKLLR